MKINDKKILREKSVADLLKQIESLKKELSVVRMQFAVGKLKDVKLMSKLREKIAIAKTVIEEKSKLTA
jgi:ribosomal protein L29